MTGLYIGLGSYLVITGLIIWWFALIDKKKEVLFYKENGRNFYQPGDWNQGTLLWEDRGTISEGCATILCYPLVQALKFFTNVKYALRNFSCYIINGRYKRTNYARKYARELASKEREYENDLHEDPEYSEHPVNWKIQGRKQEWSIKEVIKNESYRELADDILLTIPMFYLRGFVSFLGLVLWPLTMFCVVFVAGCVTIWSIFVTTTEFFESPGKPKVGAVKPE